MEYAVIRTGGKQYKVSAGDTIQVDKLNNSDKKEITFDDVLLVSLDGKLNIGSPVVSGARVRATLVDQIKGDKIRVQKFKAKSRYRRTTGFRAQMSVIKIEKIEVGAKTEKKVEEPTKTAPTKSKK